MTCPVCGGRSIGKVGVDQYYCWNCCVEFNSHTDKIVVYDLDEEGGLVAWEDFYLENDAYLDRTVQTTAE